MAKKTTRKRYKIYYSEGDCFAVPLLDGGFARGVVARMDRKGGVLGYFYGPKFMTLDNVHIDSDIVPDQAIEVRLFGDLGLVTDEWKVIGKLVPWIRENWPIPIYGFVEPLLKKWGELRYISEKTLLLSLAFKVRVSVEEASKYPASGLSNAKAIESRLTKLLSDPNNPPSPMKIVPVPREYQ